MAANGCSRERVICGDGAFIRRLPYEASKGFAPCHSEPNNQSTDSNNGLLLLADIALANDPDTDEVDVALHNLEYLTSVKTTWYLP